MGFITFMEVSLKITSKINSIYFVPEAATLKMHVTFSFTVLFFFVARNTLLNKITDDTQYFKLGWHYSNQDISISEFEVLQWSQFTNFECQYRLHSNIHWTTFKFLIINVTNNLMKTVYQLFLLLLQFVWVFYLFPRYWKYTTLPGDFNIFCFICVYNKDYNRKKSKSNTVSKLQANKEWFYSDFLEMGNFDNV